MTIGQDTFITFFKTGQFGLIGAEMGEASLSALIASLYKREDPPATFLIEEDLEITLKQDRIEQIRISFYEGYDSDLWVKPIGIQWHDYIASSDFESLGSFLQENHIGHKRIFFSDDTFGIKNQENTILLLFSQNMEIESLRLCYEGFPEWKGNVVSNSIDIPSE